MTFRSQSFLIIVAALVSCAPESEARLVDGGEEGIDQNGVGEPAETTWSSHTPMGVAVQLTARGGPLVVGDNPFLVTFEGDLPAADAVTVDLISSDMPTMGIRRYPVETVDSGFTVRLQMSMPGTWLAYVNIGDGVEAAEFRLEVSDSSAGGHMHSAPNDSAQNANHGSAGHNGGTSSHGSH